MDPDVDPSDPIAHHLAALSARSATAREHAATALGVLRSPFAVPALTRSLSDTNTRVATAAAAALAAIGGTGLDVLEDALGARDEWTRVVAAGALASIGDERGLPVLADALDSEDLDVCGPAVKGLLRLGEDGVAPVIAALASTSTPRHVREVAASGLGEIATPPAREALAKAAASDDRFVQRAAQRALSRLG